MSFDASWPNTTNLNLVEAAPHGSLYLLLGHMTDSLRSIDLFRCESIHLRSHWVMVVMNQFTRRLIGFGLHAGDANRIALCRMFNRIISGNNQSHYLSSDHDPLFEYHRWQANLRILEIEPIQTAPYTAISHPFVERLIGTIRREFLDQTLFWNVVDLARRLEAFQDYYNHSRFHASLEGDTPAQVGGQPRPTNAELECYRWQTHCRGLVQLPMAA